MDNEFLPSSHFISSFYFQFTSAEAKVYFYWRIMLYLTKSRAAWPGSRKERAISNLVVLAFYFLSLLLSEYPFLLSTYATWLSRPLNIDNWRWQTSNSWIYNPQFKLHLSRLIKSKFLIPKREHLEQLGSGVYLWSSQLR